MMAGHDMHPQIAVLPPLAAPSAADEANHRLANHLQMLSALISAEARSILDSEGRAVLERTQQRLAAIGCVHRQLYMSEGAQIDLGVYLEDLGEQLAQSCPAHHAIIVDAHSVPISSDVAASIGMLTTELVMNACKHAYGFEEEGGIFISLRRLPEGIHEFRVEDHGRGAQPGRKRDGLGSRLIDATVRKLQACAVLENMQPGTRFRMILPF